jgi:hypothetical protein
LSALKLVKVKNVVLVVVGAAVELLVNLGERELEEQA